MTLTVVLAAKYLFVLVLMLAAIVWLTRPRRQKWALAATVVFAGLIGLGLIKLAAALVYDPRPFVVQHVTPLIPHVADNGFPSDHTALTMVVALSVALVAWRWGVLLAALSLSVGAARVAAGIHSPVDIAGSVVIAILAVAAGRLVASWVLSRWGADHRATLEA